MEVRGVLPRLLQGFFRSSTGEEFGGEWWIRTTEGISQQIYSLPHLTALVTPHIFAIRPEKIQAASEQVKPNFPYLSAHESEIDFGFVK